MLYKCVYTSLYTHTLSLQVLYNYLYNQHFLCYRNGSKPAIYSKLTHLCWYQPWNPSGSACPGWPTPCQAAVGSHIQSPQVTWTSLHFAAQKHTKDRQRGEVTSKLSTLIELEILSETGFPVPVCQHASLQPARPCFSLYVQQVVLTQYHTHTTHNASTRSGNVPPYSHYYPIW